MNSSKARLFYIDNLRIFLIALVVLHHLIITYGAPGSWYYNESQASFPLILPMAMFTATNQAFFMGMFFFISAFFIIPSLTRKGTARFTKERLVRLGIPTVIFYFLISPFSVYIRAHFIEGSDHSFWEFLKNGWGFGFGPMWFVEALIIFTFAFLLIRLFKIKAKIKFPGTGKILLFAFLIGLGQYIIRIWLPVGWSMPFTGFQFPHFLQYIFLFAMGVVAYQNNWFDSLNSNTSWHWFIFGQILILIVFPFFTYFGGAEKGIEPFMGGFTWQCFAYSIWEQLVGFSLIYGLFGVFKKKFNIQGKLAKLLSAGAYGVYVIHTPVLVALSAVFLQWQIHQLLKFLALAPIALIVCFLIASLFKKIPGVNKIL